LVLNNNTRSLGSSPATSPIGPSAQPNSILSKRSLSASKTSGTIKSSNLDTSIQNTKPQQLFQVADSVASKIKVNSKLVKNDSVKHHKLNNSRLLRKLNSTGSIITVNNYNSDVNNYCEIDQEKMFEKNEEIYCQINENDHYENLDELSYSDNIQKANKLNKTNENESTKASVEFNGDEETEGEEIEIVDDNEDDTNNENDDDVTIEDYSCFDTKDLNTSSKKLDEETGNVLVLNDTKVSNSNNQSKPANHKKYSSNKLIKILPSTSASNVSNINAQTESNLLNNDSASNQSISTSSSTSALLPPLPRTLLTHSVSLAPITVAGNNNSAGTKASNTTISSSSLVNNTDFDRNLHLRRSKRYIRQAPNNLVVQEININSTSNHSSNYTTSPSNQAVSALNSIKENAATSNFNPVNIASLVSSTGSNLVKAVSTPSILDKIKIESIKINSNKPLDDDTIIENKLNNQHENLTSNWTGSLFNDLDMDSNKANNDEAKQLNKSSLSGNHNFAKQNGNLNERKYLNQNGMFFLHYLI
jgi:hypothetical protein